MKSSRKKISQPRIILPRSPISTFMPIFSIPKTCVYITHFRASPRQNRAKNHSHLPASIKFSLGTQRLTLIQEHALGVALYQFLDSFLQCRFRSLTPTQRKYATAIKNPTFLNNFCRCLPARSQNTEFNLETGKAMEVMVTTSDDYFEGLVRALLVGWCSEPVVYFNQQLLEKQGLLEWLDKIANGKLFEYNCDGEDNLLWFSPKSFSPISNPLANQIQKQILASFHQKTSHLQQVQKLKDFLIGNNKKPLAQALEIPLVQFIEMPEKELNKLLEKIRLEEDKLHAINAEKLFLQMENESKVKRNRRKIKKRKEAAPTNEKIQVNTISQNGKESSENTNSNLQILSNNKSQEQENETSPPMTHPEAQNYNEYSTTNNYQSSEVNIQPQKEEEFNKQCHSDHQPSTNDNQRSISKSESTSRLDQTFHHEEIIQNNTPVQDEIKQEKMRRRRKRRGKKQQEALEQLRTQICHKFMTRQLENISEFINASTNKMLEARVIAFERVRILIQNNYPFSNAVLFGSNAIGLALPTSDVDILVIGFHCTTRSDCGELLNHIGYVISCMEWAINCEFVNAKVPVLKLEIDTSIPFMQLKGAKRMQSNQHFELQTDKEMIVKVDITINVEGLSSGGYQSTLLMKKWLEKFPFAQKMVILFKHLLSFKRLNENYRGGVGSYCLFVMVMAYIQQNPKCAENELSRTFLDLLIWYSQTFNNQKYIVWLRQEGANFVQQDIYQRLFEDGEERKGLLRLVDPTTSRIMSGSCSQYVKIKEFFKEILQKLSYIEEMIEEELKNTSQSHSELTKMFQNRRQSEKWFKNAEEKHGWALMSLMGINL